MITQKNTCKINVNEPKMSRERDTKKKRLRARNARFSGAENARARAREPAEMAMMTIHNTYRRMINRNMI